MDSEEKPFFEAEYPERQRGIIETEVHLNRDIPHVESNVNVAFHPVFRKGGRLLFRPHNLPYPRILNDDQAKGYLKEEELAWVKLQISKILNWIYFANDYGLVLPFVNKQIAKIHSILVYSRSREMAALRLMKTNVNIQTTPTSPWLLPKELEGGEEEKGAIGEYIDRLKPKPGEMNFTGSNARDLRVR